MHIVLTNNIRELAVQMFRHRSFLKTVTLLFETGCSFAPAASHRHAEKKLTKEFIASSANLKPKSSFLDAVVSKMAASAQVQRNFEEQFGYDEF